MSYTIKSLLEAEDMAGKHGFGDFQEARFPRHELEAESTGLGFLRVKPGRRQPFAHRHAEAEEVYVVISGDGRVKLDHDVVDVKALDAIRVAPSVGRAFEAGPDGLEVLAFGPHHARDAEMIPIDEFWED